MTIQPTSDGQLTRVNLIVSTGHNNYAMSKAVDMVAKEYIHGPDVKEGMLNRVEHAIARMTPASPAPPMQSGRCRWRSASTITRAT